MRGIQLFVLIFLLGACSVDELSPCEGIGQPGQICKEIQYVYDRYNGQANYTYNEQGELIEKEVIGANGRSQGSATYTYVDGQLIQERIVDQNGVEFSLEENTYNGDTLIQTIQTRNGVVTTTAFDYVSGLLEEKRIFTDGTLSSVHELEYYTGTSELYRTLIYNAENELISIEYTEWFGDDLFVLSSYDGLGNYLGKELFRYNAGNIIQELTYSASDNVRSTNNYTYSGGYLSQVSRLNENGEEFERISYKRY